MDIRERALAYLDDEALVQLTRDLVRMRSINPPGDEAAVATCVAERFERAGMFADVVPHEEAGRASVVGGIRGIGERPALLFSGHLDTVPAGENWQHDILAAEASEGKIWGLGTTDMKSGVAAMVVAMDAIRRSGVSLKGDRSLPGPPGKKSIQWVRSVWCSNRSSVMWGSWSLVSRRPTGYSPRKKACSGWNCTRKAKRPTARCRTWA